MKITDRGRDGCQGSRECDIMEENTTASVLFLQNSEGVSNADCFAKQFGNETTKLSSVVEPVQKSVVAQDQ